jgi:protocatechuate 3,4-dioxygenase beta subunit
MSKYILLSLFSFPLSFFGQDVNKIIESIDLRLKKKEITVTNVLTSDSLVYLHSLTPFREVIKNNAVEGKTSIVTKNEPGQKITIKGTVVNQSGNPLSDLTIYVYQTSDKGWYSDTSVHFLIYEGDYKYARLFGYFKTDRIGKFCFETIKPKGYPKSDLAAHIHIQMWTKEGNSVLVPGELQFEDDPRMTAERREKSLAQGFLLSQNSGTATMPIYEYKIVTRSE